MPNHQKALLRREDAAAVQASDGIIGSAMADTPIPSPSYNKTASSGGEAAQQSKRWVIGGAVLAVALLALGFGAVWLLMQPGTDTARVRDIFIIFMALETLLIGVALIVLIVQLARLINLLQNEVRPILDATNETASTLRGTAAFLSDNLAEPVIKLNEYVAALQKFVSLLKIGRK